MSFPSSSKDLNESYGSLFRRLSDLLAEERVSLDVIGFAAREVERVSGWKGEPWGWLNASWTGDSDSGTAEPMYVRADLVHPGIAAARRGSVIAMRRLLDFGMEPKVRFDNTGECDLVALSARSRGKGLLAEFLPVLPEGRLVSSWLLGCASSLWAEGVSEVRRNFPRFGMSGERVACAPGHTMSSPMETLLWNQTYDAGTKGLDTLRGFLDLVPASRWDLQREEMSEIYAYDDTLSSALHAGAWWAVEDLVVSMEQDMDVKSFAMTKKMGDFLDEGFSDEERAERHRAFSLFQETVMRRNCRPLPSGRRAGETL